MGCWNETCGFSNLGIDEGDEIRIMAIKQAPKKDRVGGSSLYRAFDLFQPITILARGTYNDYGWIDFAEGEEERFFASALSIGVGLVKEEDSNPEFPPDTYQWMIREDVFQMLAKLPIDSWGDDMPKTVGESIEKKRRDFKSYRAEIREIGPERDLNSEEDRHRAFMAREGMSRIFGGGEMPHWPLKNQLNPMFDRDEVEDAVRDRNLEDLLDIWRVFIGMDALRKGLMPCIGAGSQDFNEDGYKLFGQFMVDAMVERRKKWGEDDYEEDEDEIEGTPEEA